MVWALSSTKVVPDSRFFLPTAVPASAPASNFSVVIRWR